MVLLDIIDSSHILDKIKKIPPSLIIEIIVIIIGINLLFSIIYYNLYNNNKASFKNIHLLDSKKNINYFDFFYYSNTLFFSLGYDIIPQTNYSKIFTIIHMKLSFIITTIFISKIVAFY